MAHKQQVSFALAALATGMMLPTPGAVRADHEVLPVAQVDSYLQTSMKSRNIPGISVTVARGGSVILERSYGFANVELQAPLSPKSVFEIGTMSKQFTAAGVMLLVQDGKIALDDPILTIMPELPAQWSPVTIRHLLTHTSGIPSYTNVTGFWAARSAHASTTSLLALVKEKPLLFQPGEKWSSSSTDYLVLGRIIERVTRMSYSRFLTERIFHPLGLGLTRVNDHATIIPNRVAGYSSDQDSTLRNAQTVNPTRLYASGSIASTPGDLVKWTTALAAGKLLKPAALAEMWTPYTLKDGTKTEYGFGWYVHPTAQGTVVEHGGGATGFRTQIVRYGRDAMTVALFTNTDIANPFRLADDVHRILTGDTSVRIR